ncbi:MAG: radical SAM protein [Thermoplasmatales archaeon]|nr:radical SAM protein [Thermoplasmatales archaeon]
MFQKNKENGARIVLTASHIEMSDFHLNPFIAFTGGFPSKVIPVDILRKYWYPITEDNDDGSAKFAPYGLRKMESVLTDEYGEKNVVTCTQYNLHKFVGPNTKVVGISTMDPLGIGFVSRTYTSIVGFGDEPLAAAEFKELINHPVLKKYKPKIIVGGAGAWQIIRGNKQEEYGIDTVMTGEGEHIVPIIFRKALNNEMLPKTAEGEKPKPEEISLIKKPALFGVVEITRGCGRGCQFCSPTMRTRYSFPLEKIKKEVEVNAKAGSKMITLQTDDVFLYKCKERFIPNREAIVEMLRTVDKIPGVDYIQIAHAALAPVVYDPKMIEEIGAILANKGRWRLNGKKVASTEIGIETGSTKLMEKYMKGKVLPYKPKEWHEIVTTGIGILNDNDIYPLATLIMGLPDEKIEDSLATMELIDKLKDAKIFYVPLLFTSEEDCLLNKAKQADLRNLSDLQWDFIATCWRRNIELWSPGAKWKIMLGSVLAYYLYYRWKHGKKVLRPIMKFSGFPESFFAQQ